MSETTRPKSDLGVRTLSAIVMLAVAGGALWLGGWWWTAFVAALAFGVLWEWRGLVSGFGISAGNRSLWMLCGLIYVGAAAAVLLVMRNGFEGAGDVLTIIGAVIFTDIGAYFAGRAIGGPKIAPAISPSKTWAGLLGGMIGASAALVVIPLSWSAGICELFYPLPVLQFAFDGPCSGIVGPPPMPYLLRYAAVVGAMTAIVAQAGDFFESWMKRRAGVKDSGHLIPGHGGLFDRVDGLLAVCFVLGVLSLPVWFSSL